MVTYLDSRQRNVALLLTVGDLEGIGKKGKSWKKETAFILDGGEGCVSATGAALNVQIDMCLPAHFHDGGHVRPCSS
jgi:hypothetical protein